MMEVRIKRCYADSIVPVKAHVDDAGYDLYAHSKTYDDDGNIVYGTGIAFEIPRGYVGLIFPRSSNAKKDLLLSNSVGVIDSGYRGEVSFKFKFALTYITGEGLMHRGEAEYNVGDRIGQIIIMPYPDVTFVEAEELSSTERGEGGYGSSGA